MKTRMRLCLTMILVTVMLVMAHLPACTATEVTPLALFQTAALTWPAVESDYNAGIAEGFAKRELTQPGVDMLTTQAAQMGTALKAQNLVEMKLVPWDTMAPWVTRGIDTELIQGKIGPGVADSLREQLSNYTATIHRLQQIQ